MTFFAFGLNHDTAPVGIREAFAFKAEALCEVYRRLPAGDDVELMILSTCNRTEAYLVGSREDALRLRQVLAEQAGRPWPEDAAFLYEEEAAIRHILRVAAGVKSMIPGDAQILGQVKEAYRLATTEERVGTVLHRLLHTAFRTAKRVIAETQLTEGTASVPAAAVSLAAPFLAARNGSSVAPRMLVLGAGQMGRLTMQLLAAQGPAHLTVVNRTRERAEELAGCHGAQVAGWEERYQAVAEADVVFVATGASEPVLRAADLPDRPHRPALVVDMAVPRNVDRKLDARSGYTVVDLDALERDVDGAAARRRGEIPAAEQLCEEALAEYVAWVFHHQALQPVITTIRDTFESIRIQEVERHHGRFSELDRDELDRLTSSIVQKVLAVPVVRLKSVDPESIDFERGIKLLHTLFARPTCEDESALPGEIAVVERGGNPIPEESARCPFEEETPEASGARVGEVPSGSPGDSEQPE